MIKITKKKIILIIILGIPVSGKSLNSGHLFLSHISDWQCFDFNDDENGSENMSSMLVKMFRMMVK